VNYRGAPPGIGIAKIATGFPTIAAAGLCIDSRCGNSPGLRLQQGKGALQFLVIDHWERFFENGPVLKIIATHV
jgi:hypothetical protein